MARLYKCSGEEREVSPESGDFFSLSELQGFVDGYIEVVPLGDGKILVCDEEGKMKGKPVNSVASAKTGGVHLIVGDALICDRSQLD